MSVSLVIITLTLLLLSWEDPFINEVMTRWSSVHMCLSAMVALHLYHIKAAKVSMS